MDVDRLTDAIGMRADMSAAICLAMNRAAAGRDASYGAPFN